MYGNWRWNVGFGLFGLVFVFLIGLANNPWSISLLRGAYAAIAFFIFAFPIRIIIGMLLATQHTPKSEQPDASEESITGANVDYVTPDTEDDLNSILREQMQQDEVAKSVPKNDAKAEQFQPLRPTKLVSSENLQTEDITKAVRHLTGE